MVTPFGADGELDLDVARALARHLVAHGSEGLVLAGTTGEAPTLDDDEKRAQLLEAVLDEVGDGRTVIAGTGTNDTRHSVHLTREAARPAPTAFLVVTPYYNKPPAEGIYRHFAAIAEARRRPADRRLQHPAAGRHQHAARAAPAPRRDRQRGRASSRPRPTSTRRGAIVDEARLALYAGNDDLLLPFGELGGVGGICVASHVAGRRHAARLVSAPSTRGDLERARALDADARARSTTRSSVTVNPIPVQGRDGAARLRGRRPAAAARRRHRGRARRRARPRSSGRGPARPRV